LRINTLCNKADAARFKIILGHNFTKGDFSPEPFDNMDLSVMPHVLLGWVEQTPTLPRSTGLQMLIYV